MDADRFGSRHDRSEERYRAGSPVRESTKGTFDDSEENDKDRSRESTKHRSKDKKKTRREDKDYRSKDRDRSKLKDELKEKETEKDLEKERISVKEKRKEEKEEDRTKDKGREKDNDRDKHRVKDLDRDRDEKDRGRKKDRERDRDNEPERGREKDRGKEKSKEKEEKDKEKAKDRDRDKERERTRDRERERDHEKNKGRDMVEREQVKDISREREREIDYEKERSRDKEKGGRRGREDQDHSKDGGRDTKTKKASDYNKERASIELETTPSDEEGVGPIKQGDYVTHSSVDPSQSRMEVAERILRMKEERMKKTSEGTSEILSWVHKSRKLEEKSNLEKEKALRRSKIFEEQDNLDEDDYEVDNKATEITDSLAGVKVLHGVDKVLEGGSVVLTLKDQDILANGDLNEDVDMLENVEIGEQKRRAEAYKAAKKTSGIYVDKFNDEPGEEKKMLSQYDDPAVEEGVVLDAAGRFTGEAEKKLEELRRRLQGPTNNQAEDLNASVKISSDYFTPEEMLKFKKPKKKKSLRKREKLDLDALEAEARITGLGASDLGSRSDNKRQAAKEEEERNEAERRKSAYQTAFSKADEASRALRMEQVVTPAEEEDDTLVFADDAEDLQMSLERTRKLALKKQNEKTLFGPEAVARLASLAVNNKATDAQNSALEDGSDNKVIFTEMEEFVWGLQLNEEAQRPYDEDVFMEEDEVPKAVEEKKDETSGWSEVVDSGKDEQLKSEDEEDVVPDETLHEAPVGKGLSGVLKMLKERGTLKETIEWGGRNMDKKKSKLVGIHEEEGPKQIRMDKKKGKLVDEVPKEINLERLDEFGRVLTPKQAFRLLSHKFHGKGPGKMKQEKRMKQYHDELKQKQMTSTDVIPQSVDRMREAQAQLKTPYLVLSGNVKPGQTSDPRSGFATVEKDVPGSLTPMLGDKKVEHFLGIKRKAEPGSNGTPKKPRT
ncbi:SART-1 family protein DOT2-like [Chenopodium quinoa]|uniref:SART-1 family protein DOT2 n=1 Tax=Chenopodium quinoa TaxID=63459 RepID=A0A803LSQ2_CHEQI|nr:SART-1 family protein DOT2-like [Chenopodium quinoa]XP_021771029.1 SART-1 family protein DOT2-like [Chenopodium quinoa]XP_021771030.1 SART-1 family protein DOT2-like [Chenopodium quinoa]XP_021771031.1 SART-1 family protein DOT2-like [Chenopodium quinoa]